MLQEKLNDHRKHEHLQTINAALKMHLEELQWELKRLEEEGVRREVVWPVMVEKSIKTETIESVLVTPSLTMVEIPPNQWASTSTPPSPFQPMETCIRLRLAKLRCFSNLICSIYTNYKEIYFLSWLGRSWRSCSMTSSFKLFGNLV